MRSVNKLLPLILLIVSIVLSGCINDEESSSTPGAELHGTWLLIGLKVNNFIYQQPFLPYWIMTFSDDGTGTAIVDDSIAPYLSSGQFNWSVESNKLTISDENNETITVDYSVVGVNCIITLLYDYNSDGAEDSIISTFEKQEV